MAWAIVRAAAAGSTTGNNATTVAADFSTVTFLLAFVAGYDGHAALTDSQGNMGYTQLTGASKLSQDNGGYLSIHYMASPSVSATMTFTASSSVFYPGLSVFGLTGNAASPFDQENGASSAAALSLSSGSLTPSENSCLVALGLAGYAIVSGYGIDGDTSGVDQGNGTFLFDGGGTGSWYRAGGYAVAGQCTAYSGAVQIQTTATARNPSQAWSAGLAVCAANIASFKIPAAGGGKPYYAYAQQRERVERLWKKTKSSIYVPDYAYARKVA